MKTRQVSEFKDTEIGKIPNDWEVAPLGDFISHLGDYHSNGSYKKLKDNVTLLSKENFAIMIRTTNFEQDDFSDNLRYVDKNAYDFLAKSKVEPYDIIMNKIANAGSTYLMPKLEKPVSLGMNLFLIRIKDLDQKYVYYFLKDRENYVKSFAQGSVTKTITKDNVRKLQIAFPKSIEEQKSIVKILSDLNSEIVNIQNQNKILEQIVQAIFKSWFVDFDGVTEFEDSELGQIPKGWRVGTISDFGEIITGKTPPTKKSEYYGNDFSFITIPDMHEKMWIVKTERYLSNESRNDFSKYFLLENSVLVSCIATVGLVSLNYSVALTNQQINSITCSKNIPYTFVYCMMNTLREQIIRWASAGSATPNLNKGDFSSISVFIPHSEILENFHNVTKSLFEKIQKNTIHLNHLEEIRDSLLPKLMSGQIRV